MKPVKALILGILLLVPILIFIFVSVFGTHHFGLRGYYPKLDEAGEVIYNAAGDTVFQAVPYFELLAHTGDTISQSVLDSNLYVAHFFAPDCSGTCQKVFSQIARVQEVFANKPSVNFVSIAVDAQQVSLEPLQQLAQTYGAIDEQWYLLTGPAEQVHPLVQKGFKEQLTLLADGSYSYSHRLLLVDRDKVIRGIYDGTDREEVDRLVTEIKVLLDEYSKRK